MKTLSILVFLLITAISINSQTVITVTKTTDYDPFLYFANPDDPTIVGTLQWAIRKANESVTPSVIEFAIAGSGQQVIYLNYELPTIIKSNITIDATTQPGYIWGEPSILIDGNNNFLHGIRLESVNQIKITGIKFSNFKFSAINCYNSSYCSIINNVINNIGGYNLKFTSAGLLFTSASHNTVKGNIIGTDINNNSNLTILGYGIVVSSSGTIPSEYNTIGGVASNENNIIAYCGFGGINIYNAITKYITISGNRIFNNPVAILLSNGANNDKQAPVITSYSDNTITGTSQPNDIIEIFGSTGNENANEFLGSATADASGNWTTTVASNSWAYVVATATDGSENTSKLCNAFLNYHPLTVNYNIIGSIDENICSISLSVHGGQPPYDYSWNTGDNTDALTDVPIGDYIATVNDATGESQQTEITEQEIITVLRTVGLTQMKLFPLPQNSYIDFNDVTSAQIINLPYYGWNPIHNESDLNNSAMNEHYLGQHPKYAQTIVNDKEGNLLFFIVDNNIYNKDGNGFYNSSTLSYETLTDKVIERTQSGSGDWVMDPEIIIVPIIGTCNEFHVFYTVFRYYTGTGLTISQKLYYRKLTYTDENNIELSIPNELSVNFIGNDACAAGSRVHLSISDYRTGSNDYLLFVHYQEYLLVMQINNDYIEKDINLIPNYYAPGGGQNGFNRSEMDAVKVTESDNSQWYYLALPYDGNSAKYKIMKIPYDFTLLQTSGFQYVWDIDIMPGTSGPYSARGTEFSPNNNYLYFTFTEQNALYYLNLDFVHNNTFPSTFTFKTVNLSGDNPVNYQYSQIELGRDGRLYYINNATKKLSYLENPNNPSNHNWKKYGDSGYLYSYLGNLYPSLDYLNTRIMYIFPDQVDGSDYETNYPFFPTTIDIWPSSYPSNSVTWTPSSNPWNKSEVVLSASNTIPAGQTITIKNMKIYFTDDSYLELSNGSTGSQKGAKLILDNTTFSSYGSCPDNSGMWRGITLNGASGYTQYSVNTVQPSIELKNNSKFNSSTIGIQSYNGGIVKASGSTFRNNSIAISLYSFQNPGDKANMNASYINNSVFLTDKELNTIGYDPNTFINLEGVYGINIISNSFSNSRKNVTAIRGYGIFSFGATYNVKSSCSVPVLQGHSCPVDKVKSSSFTGLGYGIYADAPNTAYPFSVDHANFTGNYEGISINGINGVNVTNCNFTSDNSYSGDISYYGMYLTGCDGYIIQENNFTGGTSGINFSGSGATYNKLYNNTFTNLINDESNSVSVIADGTNGVSNGTGLEIKCNDFTNNPYNIYVHSGLIKKDQGQNLPNNPVAPAGNTFISNEINLQSNFLVDETGTTADYYNYYYHAQTPKCSLGDYYQYDDYHVKATGVQSQYIKEQSCPSLLNTTPPITEATGVIRSINITINNEQNQFNQLVDGGNTSMLLQKIQTIKPANYASVCNQLIIASPYLSDTVLLTFMQNDFRGQPNKRRDILIANSPLPQKAKDELVNIWLPKPFMAQVEALQNGTNAREQKEQQIITLQSNKQDLLNSVVSSSLQNDSVPQVLDSLVTLLQEQTEHEAKFTLVPLLNRMKRYSDAENELSELQNQVAGYPVDYQNEINDYIQLQELLIELADTTINDSIFVRNNEAFLTQLAESGKTGFANAQSLLEYYGIAEFQEIVHLPNSTVSNKSMKLPNQANHTNQSLESAVLSSDNIFIYPNPVKNNLTIETTDDLIGETIYLYNNLGQLVFDVKISENNTKISTDKLNIGNYYIRFSGNSFSKVINIIK